MIRTTNYNLIKPILTDKVDVNHLNENSDIIDAKLKDLDNKSVVLNKVSIEAALGVSVNKSVPINAVFTDTIVDITGKADKSYVDNKVKTDVPLGAKFTDTLYSHPSNHPASIIVETSEKSFVSSSDKLNWNGKQNKLVAGSNISIDGNVISASGGDGTGGTSVEIEDNLISTSKIKALSANQGGILDGKISTVSNNLSSLNTDYLTTKGLIINKADKSYVDGKVKTDVPLGAIFTDTIVDITGKADISYVNNRVKTIVPTGAIFTDTVTSINGKTGAISKEDILALGIVEGGSPYVAGNDISIIDNTISFTGQTSLSEGEIKLIKVNNSVNSDTVNGFNVGKEVPIDALFTDTTYLAGDNIIINGATINAVDTVVTRESLNINNVDNVKQMPINNGILESYTEKIITTNGNINLTLGNVFKITPSSNVTLSITDAKSNVAHSFTLRINQLATPRTITFPATVNWGKNGIPDMTTANKLYILTFMTVDGGITWEGMFGGEF